MTLLDFLKRWGLYQNIIAEHLGISRGIFHSKAMRQFNQKFSDQEKQGIVDYINSIPRVTVAELFPEQNQPQYYVPPCRRKEKANGATT